jgi:hypothetical protein
MKVKDLVGKTVIAACHTDNDSKGVVLTFTDGTVLEVTERMTGGQLGVWLDQEHCGEGIEDFGMRGRIHLH